MKKQAVLLAVVLLGLSPQIGQTANLQAGWYVKLGGVALYGFDGTQERGVDWHFMDGLGTFGPFEVTASNVGWIDRVVSVPQTATGVTAGTAVYLAGEPDEVINFSITNLVFAYETDYDATQMRVELLIHRATGNYDLLWSQDRSGYDMAIPDVLGGSGRYLPVGDSIAFRVTTLPEPCTIMVLGIPIVALLCSAYRRAKS